MRLDYYFKASSLTNAIFLCLMISVFCGCLVLVSHYQNVINTRFLNQENLIRNNESAFNYFLNHVDELEDKKYLEVDLFDNGEPAKAEVLNWGLYKILNVTNYIGQDSMVHSALIGKSLDISRKLALYTTDYDRALRLSGKTEIYGDSEIPNARFENYYINGQEGNSIKTLGKLSKSKKVFPRLDLNIDLEPVDKKLSVLTSDMFKSGAVNSFSKTTLSIDISSISKLQNLKLTGNYILRSQNKISVASSCSLVDVILIAPEVTIEKGFSGSLQIFSKTEVFMEEDVELLYPSSIFVRNDRDSARVTLSQNSKLFGGLVINGRDFEALNKRLLYLDKGSHVVGTVYNFGKTQLQGKITGSIFSDKFFLKTSSSTYENVILNGIVNRVKLPKNFLTMPSFESSINLDYGVIKKL